MLRRPQTKITLTTEDIAIYEDTRARELAHEEKMREQAAQAQLDQFPGNGKTQNNDPNGLKGQGQGQYNSFRGPAEQKTRAERLGLGGGASGESRS